MQAIGVTRDRRPRLTGARGNAMTAARRLALGVGSAPGLGAWAKLETWRQEGPSAFAKGHRERVVISDNGRVRLGQALGADRTARRRRGSGTSPATTRRRRLRRHRRRGQGLPPRGEGRSGLDRGLRRGRHAGPGPGRRRPTARCSSAPGPSGQVVEVTDPEHPAVAARPEGPVHLGPGRRRRRATSTPPPGRPASSGSGPRDGKWSLLLDSKAHPPALRGGRARRHGLRRQRRRGPDLPGRPPTARRRSSTTPPRARSGRSCVAPDGALYAGTAAEAGRVGLGRGPRPVLGRRPERAGGPGGTDGGRGVGARGPPGQTTGPGRAPPRDPASPRPPAGRVGRAPARLARGQCGLPDRRRRRRPRGLPRQGPDLRPGLAGGPPAGRDRPRGPALRGPRPRPRVRPPVARLDNGQVLSLLAEPDGEICSSARATRARSCGSRPGYVAPGRARSPRSTTPSSSAGSAPCAGGPSRPPGPRCAVQVRTGNVRRARRDLVGLVGRADRPGLGRAAESPPGRFVQYQVDARHPEPRRTRPSSRAWP